MYKQYFKQALLMLRENPFFSIISVLGTALAITMIMVIVIIFEVQTADYPPETNRSRMLFIKHMGLKGNTGSFSYSHHGLALVKACYYPMKTPEAVTAVQNGGITLATTSDLTRKMKCDLTRTDANFWKVFSFHFMEGKPFTGSDVSSGIKQAVVSEKVARQLFGRPDVIGQQIQIGRRPYRICGVVADVSMLATHAYAQIWIPYPASELERVMNEGTKEGMSGEYVVLLLAHSPADFPAIREEAEAAVKQLNTGLKDWQLDLMNQPDDQLKQSFHRWSSEEPDMSQILTQYAIILVILLLVPALNLSGLTTSRMQKRMSELGVRKAFGATRGMLIGQLLAENLLLTLLGGFTGLLFSLGVVGLMREWLFGSQEMMRANGDLLMGATQLLTPAIFFSAFLFCLLLNLLSAGIPAWRASSRNIVESIDDK